MSDYQAVFEVEGSAAMFARPDTGGNANKLPRANVVGCKRFI